MGVLSPIQDEGQRKSRAFFIFWHTRTDPPNAIDLQARGVLRDGRDSRPHAAAQPSDSPQASTSRVAQRATQCLDGENGVVS